MNSALSPEKFVEKAKKVHGDKYDYSKTNYKNTRTKVCIICPVHGEFWQKAGTHLEGHGCPKCGFEETTKCHKLTKDKFIAKAKEIHGNKYDYSKVEYINAKTKVRIICPEHGEFWQAPNDHLYRQYGCHKCGWKKEGENLRKSTHDFIKEATKKYGNKYDYSKVEYKGNNKKVCIISHEKDAYGVEIGEFWQTPQNHLMYGNTSLPLTTKRFIERAHYVHGNLYNYEKVDIKNNEQKIIITCPIHGDFQQLPSNHLSGQGCPKCKNKSVLEKRIRAILTELKIEFTEQQRFEFLGKKSLDFFLPKYNIGVECQGRQHFIETNKWEKLSEIIDRDKQKKDECIHNNIKIIYVINKKFSKMPKDIYNEYNTFNIKDIEKVLIKIQENKHPI